MPSSGFSNFHMHMHTHKNYTAQEITQPPKNTTTVLGTNATVNCHGDIASGYHIIREVLETQILQESQVQPFALSGLYVALPR